VTIRVDENAKAPTPLPEPQPPPNIRKVIAHIAEELTYSTVRLQTESSQAEISRTDDNDATHIMEVAENKSVAVNNPVNINTYSVSITHPITHQPSTATIAQIRLIEHATTQAIPIQQTLRLHIDGGANRSITNDPTLLIKNIKILKLIICPVPEEPTTLHALESDLYHGDQQMVKYC
jgi:hypothetical protein